MKLVTTLSKTSPMNLSDRICWSVMASRKSVSQYRISKFTGLSREAIRQSVKVLHGFRLAKEEDGRWIAVEPDELSKTWFSWVKDSEGKPLGQRLRYTKVVPKETGEGIAADCLLGLLRSLARCGRKSSTCRRLKKMIGISDVTIKRHLKGFAEKSLLAEVTFGKRDVSWKLADEQAEKAPKDAVVERYKEDRPRKKRAKRVEDAEVRKPDDPMKQRLLDAGLCLHSRPRFDKGDTLPCGCGVMTTSMHPGRWSRGPRVKEEGRTKAAADILRAKFLWARVDTLCDEWECVRCDAQKIPFDNQRKVFLRLITDETWYDLTTPEPAKMAPEAVGPVGRTGNSRI